MDWMKDLLKTPPQASRARTRRLYQKFFDLEANGSSLIKLDPHEAGLLGVLRTHYSARGIEPIPPVYVLLSELAPFSVMKKDDAVEALAEYVLWMEKPRYAKKSWLTTKILEALSTRPGDESPQQPSAHLAVKNNVGWCDLLYPRTKALILLNQGSLI
jgi:hypothetical protein